MYFSWLFGQVWDVSGKVVADSIAGPHAQKERPRTCHNHSWHTGTAADAWERRENIMPTFQDNECFLGADISVYACYIMCEHISDQIQIKPQIIVVEDSGKQEQEMRDVVWRRAWLRSVEKQKEWKSIMSEGRYKYLVIFLRWRDGLTRYATASGSDPSTLLTPLDSDKRNSSNRSYAKNKSKWAAQKRGISKSISLCNIPDWSLKE